MAEHRSVAVRINGIDYVRAVEPRKLLSDFIREDIGLTGTHVGCEHGACGCCTILLDGESVKSCLMFAVQADGAEITTIEGLEQDGKLHPLQQAFTDNHGLQCGYCTPGQILNALYIIKNNPDPSEEEVRVGISGNLCRCTGYVNIVKSVLDGAARMRASSDNAMRPLPVESR